MSARILVIDDTPANVKVLTEVLGSAGYHVITAAGGVEALAKMNADPPDLVLLDVVMPGLSGYEVCRQIRSHPATSLLPVIMVTVLDPRRERVAGIEAGADDFLSRPFSPPELLARVRSLLRIKALQDRTTRQAEELAQWSTRFEARVSEQLDVFAQAVSPVAGKLLMQKLAALGVAHTYPANMIVVNEGDSSDAFYIVLSGRVRAYVSDEQGREMVLGEQGPGDFFGEVALDGGPRTVSVATLESSRLAVIGLPELRSFYASHPGMGTIVVNQLIQQVRHLTQSVKNLALMDVYGRVTRLIVDLAHEKDGRRVIDPRPTQQDMALRVGASREMISRILKDLAAGGYIRIEGAQMIIEKEPPRAW